MTDPCLLLDPYLDGSLSDADAEAFETHALGCDACDAALALPGGYSAAFAEMRAVECPPEVLAAALAQARRVAPDRGAVRSAATRRTRWGLPLALAAVGALALVLFLRPSTGPDEAPIAEAVTPAEPETVEEPQPDAPAAEGLPPAASDGDATGAEAEPAAPAVRPAAPRPRRTAPVQRSVPSTGSPAVAEDAPLAQSQARPPSDPAAEPTPTDAEIEDAARDLALAFALVDDAQSRAGATVRRQVADLSSTLDATLPY